MSLLVTTLLFNRYSYSCECLMRYFKYSKLLNRMFSSISDYFSKINDRFSKSLKLRDRNEFKDVSSTIKESPRSTTLLSNRYFYSCECLTRYFKYSKLLMFSSIFYSPRSMIVSQNRSNYVIETNSRMYHLR